MGKLTAEIIRKVNDAKDIDDIKDWIWMAGDLLRRTSSSTFKSGMKEIDDEEVTEVERAELKQALLSALPRNSDLGYVCSLLTALSCTYDRDLLPLWVQYLSEHLWNLKRSNAIVHTALIALHDLDELVREIGPNGRSIADVDRNVEDAQKYLLARGIKIPW